MPNIQTPSRPYNISDDYPIVFKILTHPLFTKPRTLYDYKHSKWSLCRTTIDLPIPSIPSSLIINDLLLAVTTFETSVRQAAVSSIPTKSYRKSTSLTHPHYVSC